LYINTITKNVTTLIYYYINRQEFIVGAATVSVFCSTNVEKRTGW
jgi:hypothetical protein